MELKNLFKKNSQIPPPELFLAIEISDSLIKTAVWQIENETPSIANYGTFEAWENESSLINGLDVSLTQAVKGLEFEPTKAIFGLPESWLVGDKLELSKASLVKKIRDELGIKPIGLVTTTEAILQQIKIDEGIPPTIILLEIFPTKVSVSLTRLGQVENREEVGRSDDLAKDVEEGLVRANTDKFPARFILTNGLDLENEVQQVLSYPWQEKLNFLHLPKVETLPPEYSIKAIALSGGTEAAKSLGLEIDTCSSGESTDLTSGSAVSAADLGFSRETEPLINPSPSVSSETDDIQEKTLSVTDQTINNDSFSNPVSVVHSSRINLSSLVSRFRLPIIPRFRISLKLIFPLGIFLLTPLIAFIYYSFAAKAEIVVKIMPQNISQSAAIVLASSPQSDNITVPVAFQTLEISVNEEISTTGETLVGDKATGRITLYNRSNEPITLKSNATIDVDGRAFSVDNTVTVASSSAQSEPPFTITPGNAEVGVTATKVGVEYNLSRNTQFSVNNYPKSVLIATANNDFSGGSSRTVKAVSKDDLIKLLALANDKIKDDIEAKIKNQDPDQRSLILSDPEITEKNYSKNADQEAVNVSLEIQASVNLLTYSHTHLVEVISDQIVAKNQPGTRLLAEKTIIELNNPQKKAENYYSTEIKFSGPIIPKINTDDYVNNLTGLKVDKVKDLLEKLHGYSGLTLKISPNLPFLNQYLPRQKNHITLDIIVQ